MGKLLFFVFLALAVLYLFRRAAPPPPPARFPPESENGEDMVRCAVCGVHLPRSEALMTRGVFYCGPAHQQEGRAKGRP